MSADDEVLEWCLDTLASISARATRASHNRPRATAGASHVERRAYGRVLEQTDLCYRRGATREQVDRAVAEGRESGRRASGAGSASE